MTKLTADIAGTVLTTAGILLLLVMAFDLFPPYDKIFLFSGVVCFVVSGALRSIIRLHDKHSK